MQLNPARGRKLVHVDFHIESYQQGFMQLNPARGRKLGYYGISPPRRTWFMQLNPARGRKLL